MIITLLPQDAIVPATVGMRRQFVAMQRGMRPDGNADEARYFDHHIFGAMAEFVVARLLNLFWEPRIGSTAGEDVGAIGGGAVGVRLRRMPGNGGDLAIRRKDKDHVPQVLVHNHGDFTFIIKGWEYAGEARARGVWNECSNVWFVPPPYRSTEELIAMFANPWRQDEAAQ